MRPFSLCLRSCPLLAAIAMTGACIEPAPIGGTPVDSETDPGDDDSTGDPPPGLACPDSPEDYACTVPTACDFPPCGGPTAVFDADGCLRATCQDDTDCPDGRTCVRTGDWGGAPPSSTFCEMAGEECACGATADGNPDVRVCVPDEEVPEVDEALCSDQGSTDAFSWSPAVPPPGMSSCTVVSAVGDDIDFDCTGAIEGPITLTLSGALALDLADGTMLNVEYIVDDHDVYTDEWVAITSPAGPPEVANAANTSVLLPPGAAGDWWGVNFGLTPLAAPCPFVSCSGEPFDIGTRPAGIRAGDAMFFEDVFPGQSADIPGKFGGWIPRISLRAGTEGTCADTDAPPQWYSLSVVKPGF